MRILDEHILPVSAQTLVTIAANSASTGRHVFLPHYSSEYFRTACMTRLRMGFYSVQKWFTTFA
jgi:hypothetical protein